MRTLDVEDLGAARHAAEPDRVARPGVIDGAADTRDPRDAAANPFGHAVKVDSQPEDPLPRGSDEGGEDETAHPPTRMPVWDRMVNEPARRCPAVAGDGGGAKLQRWQGPS
jgi:hypothetical protein